MTQGCALFLCAVEGESAGEPLAPRAGCQLPSMSAAHLSEARSKLRLACFAQQIRLPLGVIPKMGFWVHRSSFQSQDVQEDRELPSDHRISFPEQSAGRPCRTFASSWRSDRATRLSPLRA